MTFLRNTFLYTLWNQSKWIFVLVILFILGQLFFTYKGIQNFPFYHWGMYSGASPDKDNYAVYEVFLDGQRFEKHSKTTTMRDDWYILLYRYDRLKATERNIENVINNRLEGKVSSTQLHRYKSKIMNDSDIANSFPEWFSGYMKSTLNQSFDSIAVFKSTYQYDIANGQLNKRLTEKLF